MEDKLRLNTKLYGFDGIIGRRDYFLNGVILASIALIFYIPYYLWLYSNIETISDFFNLHKMFIRTPLLLKFWFLGGNIAFITLALSNIWRRLNDINGKVNIGLNATLSALFAAIHFSYFLLPIPFEFCLLLSLICIIATLVILLKRGKITGKYPYDFTKEFNWGAFLGTWIWGLFNKSYKTLWMLVLCFTPWNTYFSLYCGLKGNEWAFKNKKCNDVEAFNKSQEKQSTIFAILFFVGIPVLYFIIIIGLATILTFSITNDIKNHPEKAEQRIEKLEKAMSKFGSQYFESHLIAENENKYYVSSKNWNRYSFKEKKNIIDMAASLAAIEREKEYKKQHPDSYKSFSKATELERTKIYSCETKKLLGEFHIDTTAFNNGSLKEIIKSGMDTYKFYNDKEF